MISNYPSFDSVFVSKQGNVSLDLALFRLAPPEVALGMMRDGKISNLNELTAEGVSLLAIKMKGGMYGNWNKSPIPSWSSWNASPQTAWKDCCTEVSSLNEVLINEQTLAASMIFAGADPWVEWPCDMFDKVNSCFFTLAVQQLNASMVGFLLDHPQCPSVEYFNQLRLHKTELRAESYKSVNSDLPLIHYVANQGHRPTLKHLIDKGMDVNQADEFGCTAVFYVKDKDVLADLVAAGAVLDHKNHAGKTPSQHWKNWLSTSSKYAEFSKILIEELKAKVSPEELRELQKPSLLQELLRGTKGSFDTIYKKSKFLPNTTFDKDKKGRWSFATVALLRQDDKTDVLLRWCQEKKVGLDHQIWEDKPYTDGLLGLVLRSPHGASPLGVTEYLQHTYAYTSTDHTSPVQRLVDDIIGLTHHMGTCSMKPINAIKILSDLCRAQANPSDEKLQFNKVLSSVFSPVDPIVLDGHPMFASSVSGNIVTHLASVVKKDKPSSSYYSSSGLASDDLIVLHSHAMNRIHDGEEGWERTLAFLFMASLAVDAKEKGWNGAPAPMQVMRSDIHSYLCANSLGDFGLEDQSIWKALQDHLSNVSNPIIEQFDTLIQRLLLQEALHSSVTDIPVAPRRRM